MIADLTRLAATKESQARARADQALKAASAAADAMREWFEGSELTSAGMECLGRLTMARKQFERDSFYDLLEAESCANEVVHTASQVKQSRIQEIKQQIETEIRNCSQRLEEMRPKGEKHIHREFQKTINATKDLEQGIQFTNYPQAQAKLAQLRRVDSLLRQTATKISSKISAKRSFAVGSSRVWGAIVGFVGTDIGAFIVAGCFNAHLRDLPTVIAFFSIPGLIGGIIGSAAYGASAKRKFDSLNGA